MRKLLMALGALSLFAAAPAAAQSTYTTYSPYGYQTGNGSFSIGVTIGDRPRYYRDRHYPRRYGYNRVGYYGPVWVSYNRVLCNKHNHRVGTLVDRWSRPVHPYQLRYLDRRQVRCR